MNISNESIAHFAEKTREYFSKTGGTYEEIYDSSSLQNIVLNANLDGIINFELMKYSEILDKCQSPIEKSLIARMMIELSIGEIDYFNQIKDDEIKFGQSVLNIYPQFKVGRYFIDFKITYRSINGIDRKLEKKSVFVECDGHEFHEKTKEQVARDKKRDRFIQYERHTLLRFTGSEIWKDASRCVNEITSFLDGRYEHEKNNL